MLTRRSLIRAIPSLLAMPAIVKASSLMPIAPWDDGGIGDGLSLFSSVHPLPPNWWDNRPADATDLSEESLKTLLAEIERYVEESGKKIAMRPTCIHFFMSP